LSDKDATRLAPKSGSSFVINRQPGLADRIVCHGVGKSVRVASMNQGDVPRAIQEVLGNPGYRETARRFQRTIAQTHGPDRAADVLERAFQSVHESGGGGVGEAPGHRRSLTDLKRWPIVILIGR
jgi:hypothetical protein